MELKAGYKQTEVGVMPEDWALKSIDSIATIATGNTPPTQDTANYGDAFLFVSPTDLGHTKFISQTEKMLSKKGFSISRHFPKESILFVCIGSTIGKCGIATEELTSNQQINAIFPSSVFSTDYVYYAVSAAASKIKALAGEQAVPIVNKTQFSETVIPLPPTKAEQEAIAEALSDADALIESLEQLIAKKRLIKQGAMQELLTGKKRLPGFSGEWAIKQLGDVIEKFIGGGTPSRSNQQYWGDELSWVTVKDFATFDPWISQEMITRLGLKHSASHLIPKGTLITSTRMALGKAVIYKIDVAINQDMKALFPKPVLATQYLYFWFQYHGQSIDELGSGSTVKGISLPDLKKIDFQLPSCAEQTAIATILSDMDTEITELDIKLSKARKIKQGMMQALLTGKTRLI